ICVLNPPPHASINPVVVVPATKKTHDKPLAEVDSPNGSYGPELALVEVTVTGALKIEVRALEKSAPAGKYQLSATLWPSRAAYDAAEIKKQDEIRRWLGRTAVPLRTVQNEGSFADLAPLKKLFQKAHVVGLGEATHGTREFFQFKHRMLAYLVKELGFTVFAMEAGVGGIRATNAYVTEGKGTLDDAMRGLGFMVWTTEEVAALLQWLREHNQTQRPERRVQIVGVDCQEGTKTAAPALEYLKSVQPELATRLGEQLSKIGYGTDPKGSAPVVREILAWLIADEGRLIAQTGRARYDEALSALRVVVQYADLGGLDMAQGMGRRDRYMASNLLSLLAKNPKARVVFWGHNAHVGRLLYPINSALVPMMGWWLGEALKERYLAVGMAFGTGEFQAQDRTRPGSPMRTYKSGKPAVGSVEAMMAAARLGDFLVPWRGQAPPPFVTDWLHTPHSLRTAGGYNVPKNITALWEKGDVTTTNLGAEFDALLFIAQPTAARSYSPK
ncbi:erythromycin esterase family protein, partial [Armatimonas sp.]|uniref:erythromycin esterase family protein n=1 Tax=Armatimonas sp. TaxID=1872638 RepID=UPI00286C7D35